MKHLLLTIFYFAIAANLCAENYSADTILLDSWANNAWQPDTRIISIYAGCRQLSTISQSRDGSAWINNHQNIYSYVGDQLSEVLQQGWNGNGWDNSSKTTYTYDGSFNELTAVTQDWSGGAWVNYSRETNTYDATGYLISTLSETFERSCLDK